MRDNPRYSIIPAGAVTDRRLERSDLRVLCLLGCHSDKLGWCEPSSQSALAAMIDCSRQTFQRSIARLVDAGWVQTRATCVSQGGRSYASYAYRVLMDRDDPSIVLSGYEVTAPTPDDPAHRWATLPTQAGQPCPRMHGQQEDDQAETKKDDSDSARREGHSNDAAEIAEEIAEIAGVDPAKHAAWFIAGPALIVQRWLDGGYLRWHLIEGVKRGMAKRASPPDDIRYFGKLWSRVRGEAETPVPQAQAPPTTTNKTRGMPRPGSREDRQERTADALDKLRNFANGRSYADDERASSEAGRPAVGGLSLPKPA